MLSVKEVADRLKVSIQSVYRLVETGRLTSHRIGLGRGTIRISERQLVEYLSSAETSKKN